MVTKARPFGVILVLAIATLHVVASEQRNNLKPGVLFKGTSIPKPPQQTQPWKPPANRPPVKWITAAEELYRCGFADPRGCDYREVKLTCGSSLWGGSSLVAAHAWVLPVDKDAKPDQQRFAVTWSGIVYPVVEVGPPAKLASDVDLLMKAFAAAQNDTTYTGHAFVRGHPEFAERTMRLAPESRLVAQDYMFALKSCLLLRLGEGEFASRVWQAWSAANSALISEAYACDGDPYMVLAWEWGWALFDHAIAAHLRGDDVVALDTAKMLVLFKESVPRVAGQRGISQRKSLASFEPLDYLPLYDPPETLLEDAARRVKTALIRRALDVDSKTIPDQSQRISSLVRDLEDVSAGPEYKDGDVPLAPPHITYGRQPVNPLKTSPIVRSLIKEGEPAVEPLLKCLVDDRRLTRVAGAGFHEISGDLLPPRDLITVDVAAYTALCGILKAEHFGPSSEDPYYNGMSREQRHTVAEEIRRRFEKIKGLPPEEAWLKVLADPNLTGKAWLEVAERIVAPAGRMPATDVQPEVRVGNDEPINNSRPLAGETLRTKRNPSVSELLARRCDDAAQQGSEWGLSTKLAMCLVKWDVKAAIPVLDRRIAEWRQGFNGKVCFDRVEPFVTLVEVALQAGDEKAAVEYAVWLRATRPDDFSFFELSMFMPLWRHPDNPKLTEIARWLFLANDSPWHPLHELTPLNADMIITSPTIGIPAFRELLKRELSNISVVRLTRESLPIEVLLHVGDSSSIYASDANPAKPEAKRPLRVCDYYAAKISALEGTPRFEPSWPEKRRDETIREISRFLDRWGECFRDRSKSPESRYDYSFLPRLCISRLSQPATAEDVSRGLAIFSLRDRPSLQVRVVPLKPYPHIARWKTLKEFPLQTPGLAGWPKDRTTRDPKVWASLPKEPYDREGLIWQAEEVLQDGKWRRYYGFVGNHIIAKAPAEEIDLLDEFSPAHPHRW